MWHKGLDDQSVSLIVLLSRILRSLTIASTSSSELAVLTNLVTAWLVLQVSVDVFVTGTHAIFFSGILLIIL